MSYLPVDRDQQFLLPPSMRDWLPEGHLAWFVLEVLERVDTSKLHARHRNDGVGRRAYDPEMLLALLLYAYCTGVRSSRQIERLCVADVAFRVLAAGHAPDHTTIARFRQRHEALAVSLFTDVLMLCAEAGLASVGVVAVDGTKVAAGASLKRNRTRAQIEAEIKAMFAEAAETDAAEDEVFGDARGDELPAELADPRQRGARLDAAFRELEARREAREAAEDEARQRRGRDSGEGARGGRPPAAMELELAEAALAREEARAEARNARRAEREAADAAAGRKTSGRPPNPEHRGLRRARQRLERARANAANTSAEPKATGNEERVNTTDPDSRIMKTATGWVQGYNAQAAVNEDGIVLAAEVVQDLNDVGQCQPMMTRTRTNLDAIGITEPVGVMLFDAGYLSEANLTAEGPDRLIATGKAWKLRHSDPTTGSAPTDAGPIEAMDHRLRTEEGTALYAKRQHTVEPVFGDIKELRGFRRFSRRGLDAVNAEWKLQTAAHNLLKLFRHQAPRLA